MREPRRTQITMAVNREEFITFEQLMALFPEISEMTLRTDLRDLDREGKIVRVHGGAKSIETVVRSDDLFFKKATRNMENKKQIARKAVSFLTTTGLMFLDCGTTMMEFARVFPDDKYHVITYSISSIIELARLSNPQVIMLGGRLNRFNLSTIDSRNRLDLEKMNFEVAFIAVSGYSKEQGFTCGMETDDELRYAAIRKAKKVVMLMDSSKVNRVFPIT
ncbi:MAG: DeoR/GlpR family DNA-binding transcription regulator, partial [Clostridia bacterium]